MTLSSGIKNVLVGVAITAVTALGGMTIANASDVKVLFNDIGHISKQLDRIEDKLDVALGLQDEKPDSSNKR